MYGDIAQPNGSAAHRMTRGVDSPGAGGKLKVM